MKVFSNHRNSVLLILFIIIFLVLTFFSVNVGYVSMSFEEVFSAMIGKGNTQEHLLLWVVRMPRTIVSLLIGICLAISGAVMQGVTRNALATPSMIGISSGASFATLLVIYLQDKGLGLLLPIPIAATIGGIITFLFVYTLALRYQLSPIKLILNGIAVNSCIGAINLLITMKLSSDAYNMRVLVLGGSLNYATWEMIIASAIIIVPCVIYIIYKAFYLNILNLGEELAIGLGIDLKKERKKLLYITVILTSIAAYIAGGIGFIGMIAPHIAKRLVGANYKYFLPLSIWIGANIVLLADILSRILVNNRQFVPIGTLISLIGAPYLLYLLFVNDR